MNVLRSLWRYFNGGGSHRRVIVTPVVAVLVIIISGGWHFDGWTHNVIRHVCSYRGYMLTTWHAYRMIGGALLIPNDDFWGSLPGLLCALYPLERRVGSWWTLGAIAFAHIFSSIVAGIGLRMLHDNHTLHVHDVGTSVLMVTAAAMLATITRNKWLWAFVLVIYFVDLVLSHDLASAEHTLAIVCGIASGIGYERLQDRISAETVPTLSGISKKS